MPIHTTSISSFVTCPRGTVQSSTTKNLIKLKRNELKRIQDQWRAYFLHNAHGHISSAVQYFAKGPGYVM